MVKLICRTLNEVQLWDETVKVTAVQYEQPQVNVGITSTFCRGPLIFCFVSFLKFIDGSNLLGFH